MMVPSSSIAFSEFTMLMFSGQGDWISIALTFVFWLLALPTIAGKRALAITPTAIRTGPLFARTRFVDS